MKFLLSMPLLLEADVASAEVLSHVASRWNEAPVAGIALVTVLSGFILGAIKRSGVPAFVSIIVAMTFTLGPWVLKQI